MLCISLPSHIMPYYFTPLHLFHSISFHSIPFYNLFHCFIKNSGSTYVLMSWLTKGLKWTIWKAWACCFKAQAVFMCICVYMCECLHVCSYLRCKNSPRYAVYFIIPSYSVHFTILSLIRFNTPFFFINSSLEYPFTL